MKIIDNMYYTDTHVYFWRNKAPFSNFYRRPFRYKGYNLQFTEQGFMLEKALLFDPSKVDVIARATQPWHHKPEPFGYVGACPTGLSGLDSVGFW